MNVAASRIPRTHRFRKLPTKPYPQEKGRRSTPVLHAVCHGAAHDAIVSSSRTNKAWNKVP